MTEEIRKSFEELGKPLGDPNTRAISLEEFQAVIEDYLNRGYYYGRQEGYERASHIIERSFHS